MSGFAQHLRDAIALNALRAPLYAVATDGQSRMLSRLLIATERATLPVAAWFDAQGRRFNEAGIGIVRDDFVSMEDVAAWDRPPNRRKKASATAIREVRLLLRDARKQGGHAAKRLAFQDLADVTDQALRRVLAIEAADQAHFAMSVHILESVVFGARNAVTYAERDPGTRPLARRLCQLQLAGLRLAVPIDIRAQTIHALGTGIVLNDVPSIAVLPTT